MEQVHSSLRQVFRSGRTRPAEWRIQQLKSILRMVEERQADILEALFQDLGKPAHEAYMSEIASVKKSCKIAIQKLRKWMSPVQVSTSLITFPSGGAIVPEPLGVVLVISTWNFPFLLSIDPVIGAIAAGNAVALKPSAVAPATSAVIAKLVPMYLDSSAIQVVEGSVPETTALLEQQWDKIFYTGSPRVGRIVMAAAAKHLTPVVLELGGKCPVLVDSTVDVKVTARRIVFGKWLLNDGQACISPDYVLAEKSTVPALVEALRHCLEEFLGKDPAQSTDLARIVNASQYKRLVGLLNEVRASIVHGGDKDETKLYISPTLVLDPPMDSGIMSEEIFGPLLPIISVQSMDAAIDVVNSKPKPLALYVFTQNKAVEKRVVRETSAGGMVVNDTILHFATKTLPFGGVGESGMGAYHGKFSFDAFSHHKAVLYRSIKADFRTRYPPFTSKKQLILRCLVDGDYFGVLKAILFA